MSQATHNTTPTTYDSLSESNLDYRFYRRACELAHEVPDDNAFQQGQEEGRFHFSQDASLVGTLVSLYALNMHLLSNEWLVFSNRPGQVTAYGNTPLEAVLSWTVNQPIDFLLSENKVDL